MEVLTLMAIWPLRCIWAPFNIGGKCYQNCNSFVLCSKVMPRCQKWDQNFEVVCVIKQKKCYKVNPPHNDHWRISENILGQFSWMKNSGKFSHVQMFYKVLMFYNFCSFCLIYCWVYRPRAVVSELACEPWKFPEKLLRNVLFLIFICKSSKSWGVAVIQRLNTRKRHGVGSTESSSSALP